VGKSIVERPNLDGYMISDAPFAIAELVRGLDFMDVFHVAMERGAFVIFLAIPTMISARI
jgi:hypothetical protein